MEAGSTEMIIAMIPLMYAVTKILIVEAGRIPVDDPRTHRTDDDPRGDGARLLRVRSGGSSRSPRGSRRPLSPIASSALAATFTYCIPLVVLLCIVIGLCVGTIESFMARGRLSTIRPYRDGLGDRFRRVHRRVPHFTEHSYRITLCYWL
ncbi:MAG: hypothetical protein ACLT1W_12360 [Alistipes onderdonkii]